MDKRFWSGAILVVTIVVAGASSLPALLLRPAPLDAPPVAVTSPAPQVSQPAPAPQVSQPAPAPQVSQPASVVARMEPAAPAPKPIDPAPTPEVAQPVQSQQPASPPVESAPAAPVVTFPPVQPVGIATQAGPDVAPQQPTQPTQSRAASARPDGTKAKGEKTAPRMTLQDAKKRKRSVRPAIYPLREFFAWR